MVARTSYQVCHQNDVASAHQPFIMYFSDCSRFFQCSMQSLDNVRIYQWCTIFLSVPIEATRNDSSLMEGSVLKHPQNHFVSSHNFRLALGLKTPLQIGGPVSSSKSPNSIGKLKVAPNTRSSSLGDVERDTVLLLYNNLAS